jgi:hypothetical protein
MLRFLSFYRRSFVHQKNTYNNNRILSRTEKIYPRYWTGKSVESITVANLVKVFPPQHQLGSRDCTCYMSRDDCQRS